MAALVLEGGIDAWHATPGILALRDGKKGEAYGYFGEAFLRLFGVSVGAFSRFREAGEQAAKLQEAAEATQAAKQATKATEVVSEATPSKIGQSATRADAIPESPAANAASDAADVVVPTRKPNPQGDSTAGGEFIGDQPGLESLTVNEFATGKTLYWKPGWSSLRKRP